MIIAIISGNFAIDEAILRSQGVTDFSKYAATPGNEDLLTGKRDSNLILLFKNLFKDFFIEDGYEFKLPSKL